MFDLFLAHSITSILKSGVQDLVATSGEVEVCNLYLSSMKELTKAPVWFVCSWLKHENAMLQTVDKNLLKGSF